MRKINPVIVIFGNIPNNLYICGKYNHYDSDFRLQKERF